jgi:hypothetical protein
MKKIMLLAVIALAFTSCKNNGQDTKEEKVSYAKFGDSITAEGAITGAELLEKYKTLKDSTDTLNVKVISKIKEVCQKKGCWMNLELSGKEVAFVKFKDYGFFVPKNASGSEVIANGKAFVNIISIDELKHYAKDEGKSQASIDSITKPEITYSFLADGVLIKK